MVKLSVLNGRIACACDTAMDALLVKQIPGRSYDRARRLWLLPPTHESVDALASRWPDVQVPLDILEALQKRSQRDAFEPAPAPELPVRGITPFEHQRVAVSKALHLDGPFGLFHEQGCGKTATAISLIGLLSEREGIDRVLVVCPKTVIPVWGEEIRSVADYDAHVVEVSATGVKRQRMLDHLDAVEGLTICVINYEAIGRSTPVEVALSNWGPQLIVCDEAHRIANPSTRQSRALGRLGDEARYRIAATGTPSANLPIDVFGVMKWLDSSVLGTSLTAFKSRYAIERELPGGGRMVVGMRHELMPELSEKVASISHRVTKEDALDLPERMFADPIMVDFEPQARRLYDDLQRDAIAYANEDAVVAAHVLTRSLRLQQITGGFLPFEGDESVRQVSCAKLNALREYFEDLSVKAIVFARFTAEVQAIERIATAQGLSPVVIDGSTKHRGDVVRRLQEDDDCRVFIGQIRAACEGVTLTAATETVYYSTGYSLIEWSQSLDRNHRPGQHHPVMVRRFHVRDSIDELVDRSLTEKVDLARVLMDEWRRA